MNGTSETNTNPDTSQQNTTNKRITHICKPNAETLTIAIGTSNTKQKTPNNKPRTPNAERRTTNAEQRTKNNEQQTATGVNNKQKTAAGANIKQQMNKITIYTAEASNRSIFAHLLNVFRDLPQAHELGYRLFKRNLKALYRQSLFGFAWALFPPLATAALWIFLRNNVMTMGDTGIPYPVFVLTGTILWQIFNEAMLSPLKQVTANKAMLSKINIPREGLLLSGIYEMIFNILIKIGLLIIIYLYFGQSASLSGLLLVPVGIFAISLMGFSIGLALTPLGMLYHDINKGLTVILPFLMYMTPVVYPKPTGGAIGLIMQINPLATLIPVTRNWFTAQPVQDMHLFWIFTIGFALLFVLSLIVYRLAMPMIIERIGS